ncbi:RNA polymerase subunit sigma-70 [Saccharibacillus sp. O23]|uniref:RNA polymerase sigma factor n=1 Tax=Saccharibacillus sp. O23 TaxID=2009338 RepID=UPI000B4E0513|nr:RNA polymerase sigma factor [Saccharibacillus sp. O23]OWR32669.1 RNA polymerase subunit sigma-70 [Saccharibacillus sp. O23]
MNDALTREEAEQLFKNHSNAVFGVLLALTKSKTLADDLTQETFIRAFSKYEQYRQDGPIRPWLARIAVNLARSHYRKLKWQTLFGQVPERAADATAETMTLRSERQQELWQAVCKLPHKNREVILLHYYAELPLKEAAETLSIPLGTCKSRLAAGLEKLRRFPELNPANEGGYGQLQARRGSK